MPVTKIILDCFLYRWKPCFLLRITKGSLWMIWIVDLYGTPRFYTLATVFDLLNTLATVFDLFLKLIVLLFGGHYTFDLNVIQFVQKSHKKW